VCGAEMDGEAGFATDCMLLALALMLLALALMLLERSNFYMSVVLSSQ